MNYAKFYTSAQQMLIDSLISLWFRGKAKEQEYMRYILSEKEPLIAEPVFQSIFPWEESKETFEEHFSKLGILTSGFMEALSSDKVPEDFSFPKDRHPYKHQTKSWKQMLSGKGKTIVVTSGTGSGKTECFMIPVLQDIAQRNEKDCVQAIFLYPLNALMKSQQQRMDAWCKAIPGTITYAIYNGDTEKEKKSKTFTDKYLPQLITRPQIRKNPPQILFTNPTMLNYMLVRAEDKPILEKSQGKLKWILLDEAHTYTGSSAAELSLQLRRVLDAFGVTIDEVNFAVTSATIGDEKDPNTELKLKKFVSQLTGKPLESIVVIGGKRIVPDMDVTRASKAISNLNKRFGINLTLTDIINLRNRLNNFPVLTTKVITGTLDKSISKDLIKSLELIDALGDKIESLNADGKTAALLPTRAHFFIRSISGLYACVNSKCTKHKDHRTSLGSFTTYQSTNCPECKSRMLEVATCPSCGGAIVVGETSTSKGYRMHVNTLDLDNNPFYETNQDLIEEENIIAEGQSDNLEIHTQEADGFTPFYLAKPERKCYRHKTSEFSHIFNMEKSRLEIASEKDDNKNVYKSLRHSDRNADLCPHCGNRILNLNYMRASSTQLGRILATLLLDHAEPGNTNDAEILYDGKKYITFTDNRQGSARSAMGANQDVERAWIRSSIFHKLADIRLDGVQEGGLTDEEEQAYLALKALGASIPPLLKTQLDDYEKKKNGSKIIPIPAETSWSDISHILENNSDLRKLFKHLTEARRTKNIDNPNIYLKALMVDQFGWIPKRANSLETLGLVRLTYPDLRKAKCPSILLRKGLKDSDWQDFLKMCLDYQIRGGRHYMISGEYNKYLTQGAYTKSIYPPHSEVRINGKPTIKWPSVKQSEIGGKIQEDQSRLVLLLCAALGYDDVDEFDDEKVSEIDSLLNQAWGFITSNIMESTDSDNHGYMLDLLGPKVKLQLIERGWVCPVDNVIVDTVFAGYSPRMNGYVGRNNFDRFKVKNKFNFPYFPFKTGSISDENLDEWIRDNFAEQSKLGVFSNITQRTFAQKPIYISAEHSAQQSREDLEKYEKEFNAGHLNILSCSTTMEMGVDIGGISEVVMNNVPPKSSNYLQRAGRAGRRSESKALALTFCAPNPIGIMTWNNPTYPITHITETPLLRLESKQLVQRHVNSLVFASFVSNQGGSIAITAHIRDFFVKHDGVSFYDQFLVYIDKIISGQENCLQNSYVRLVKGTCLHNTAISDAVYSTKSDIISVFQLYAARIDTLEKSINTARTSGGNSLAIKAIERQKENYLKISLLTYLAENSFLPSAGIPTGLVECTLDLKRDGNFPTLHLSQAISSYAPGNKVVKNEWIYVPSGIRLKTQYDDNTARYIIQKCNRCGYTTINYGSALTRCPECGTMDSMHGLKDMGVSTENSRFTEVVEPAAFTVAWNDEPTRNMNSRVAMNIIQPVLLEMEQWEEKTSSAKMIVRNSTSKSEILFYNRGRLNYGYAFCPYCGKMEYDSEITSGKTPLAGHKHLITGTPCPGGEANGSSIRRHVLLVGRYQTDFVELKFFDNENNQVEDTETLYSLGVILSRKLTELLGINDGEVDFGYDPGAHSIFIYDTALGGAGYSTLFREYREKVLEMSFKALSQCDCEVSCTKCLIDRKSQWYLNYLNRHKALDWLITELNSRKAPVEIAMYIPDAVAVTTDFTTEISQLSRNKDINRMTIFVDNEYHTWHPENFGYKRMIQELTLSGVSVSFAIKDQIDLTTYSVETRATVLPTLLQYDFKTYDSPLHEHGIVPLLSVAFNDGKVKTYFGKSITHSLSESWGKGDIYSSFKYPVTMSACLPINNILEGLSREHDSIMFDTRIKDNCSLSTFFNIMLSHKAEDWRIIKSKLSGKEVSIQYSDRYLFSPLGIMLLANLLKQIKKEYKLTISSLKIYVSRPNVRGEFSNSNTKIGESFRSNDVRNVFLVNALNELTGIKPEICDDGYIEHERCLTIKSEDEELCIRPDAGVSNGWKPFGSENAEATDKDFSYNWEMDMDLYNQKKNYSGILYTVSYSSHSH